MILHQDVSSPCLPHRTFARLSSPQPPRQGKQRHGATGIPCRLSADINTQGEKDEKKKKKTRKTPLRDALPLVPAPRPQPASPQPPQKRAKAAPPSPPPAHLSTFWGLFGEQRGGETGRGPCSVPLRGHLSRGGLPAEGRQQAAPGRGAAGPGSGPNPKGEPPRPVRSLPLRAEGLGYLSQR